MTQVLYHVSNITTEPHEGESWVEHSQVWVSNPRLHPEWSEYIRPLVFPLVDPSNLGLWRLRHLPHVAYRVDDLQAAIAGEEVVLGPFEPGDFGTLAFVHKDGGIVEYMQYSDLTRWFGQPTPWRPAGPR